MNKKQLKDVAVIKLYAPSGETMLWKTSITNIARNRVKDLSVAKRNFAHYLVNKYWLQCGKAEERVLGYKETYIRPIASNIDDLLIKKEEMRKEIDSLSSLIVAKRVRYVSKKKDY